MSQTNGDALRLMAEKLAETATLYRESGTEEVPVTANGLESLAHGLIAMAGNVDRETSALSKLGGAWMRWGFLRRCALRWLIPVYADRVYIVSVALTANFLMEDDLDV